MKVGINISAMNSLNKGRGIGFYTNHLTESLKKYTDIEVVVIEKDEGERVKGKIDLVHYPFFDFFRTTLKVDSKIPTVVTIHDVIPLLFPKHYPPGLKGKINFFRQKQTLKKVKAIITDSHTSTADVKKVFSAANQKVFSVYLDCSEDFKKVKDVSKIKQILEKYQLPEKYLFYSGSVNWNKNLLNQVTAAIEANVDIVLAGGGFENRQNLDHPELKDFKQLLDKYEKHPKVHILGFVPFEDLLLLVNGATAVLFVSQYEGFGLPILEAQKCGTPVITGNISSMKEVAGDGAVLVDPNNVSQIKQAIEEIINDKNLADRLVKLGLENTAHFSWENTAKVTARVYEYALSQN